MKRLITLVALAACRYGFDPIETDGGAVTPLTTEPVTDTVACHGAWCVVDCRTWSRCEVDCGTALACVVQCPEVGCTVTSCVGVECTVQCGYDASAAERVGTTATCP